MVINKKYEYRLKFGNNEQKLKTFLENVAAEVANLIAKDQYREQFQQYTRKFHQTYAEFQELLEQREQKINEFREKAAKDARLRNKNTGPPVEGYVWWDDSPMNTGNPKFGFWGLPLAKATGPTLKLLPISSNGIPPKNLEEQLEKDYVLLGIIHDWLLQSSFPIDNCNDPEPLKKLAYVIDLNLADEGQKIVETALANVKADLAREQKKEAEKPVETEQKTTCAKIKASLWKLYEVTLKVIVDAVMERVWPK